MELVILARGPSALIVFTRTGGAIFALVLIAVALRWVGQYIFQPIQLAMRRLNLSTQFMLTDFMWLSMQLQFAIAYSLRFAAKGDGNYFPILLTYLSLATIVLWVAGVSLLSQAGIRHSFKRGIFLLIMLPGTVAVMSGFLVIPMAWWLMRSEPDLLNYILKTMFGLSLEPQPILVSITILELSFVPGLRRLASWLVDGSLVDKLEPPHQVAPIEQLA